MRRVRRCNSVQEMMAGCSALELHRLEQQIGRPVGARRLQRLVRIKARAADHRGRVGNVAHPAQQRNPVYARQQHIKEHGVGMQLAYLLQRVVSIVFAAHDLNVRKCG